MCERVAGGVPPALEGLRTIELADGLGSYVDREETWVNLADEGFDRLATAEREIVDLRERVAWLEGQVACAGGLVKGMADRSNDVLTQVLSAIRAEGA